MYNNQTRNVLPPIPPLRTPIYSGRLQIGVLNHHTKRITFFHNPFPFYVSSTEPGAYIKDHLGRTVGRLGRHGQMIRFSQ